MSLPQLRIAIITLSMRVSKGERQDAGGDALAARLQKEKMHIVDRIVLPDDKAALIQKLKNISDNESADLVLTTGGTGMSPTDVTPEATLAVLEKRLTGFEVAMLQQGLQQTPHAMLSRAVAGTRARTIIINLPGNPKGAVENLEAIIHTLPHAVRVLQAKQVEDQEHRY
ncbi:MAG: molybdenum cofactor biosynthesis protein B [bacterium]